MIKMENDLTLHNHFVKKAYITILRREPDTVGKEYYLDILKRSGSPALVIAEMLNSSEGYSRLPFSMPSYFSKLLRRYLFIRKVPISNFRWIFLPKSPYGGSIYSYFETLNMFSNYYYDRQVTKNLDSVKDNKTKNVQFVLSGINERIDYLSEVYGNLSKECASLNSSVFDDKVFEPALLSLRKYMNALSMRLFSIESHLLLNHPEVDRSESEIE